MGSAGRSVIKSLLSVEQAEGRGARVRRSIGRPELRNMDPFLLLDEFKADASAGGGFPDHPHRGFETVSYMLSGASKHEDFRGHSGIIRQGDLQVSYMLSGEFKHEDFKGNSGIIRPGGLQWMTAGRGIVHSEMPHGEGMVHGLQLWVNLAGKDKMVEPAYQELLAKDIPEVKRDGVKVRVIAGEALGAKAKVRTRTPTSYLDFVLEKGASLNQPIPQGWTSFLYVLSGQLNIGTGQESRIGEAHHTLVLSDGEHVQVENRGKEPCHLILISGKPLNEPVVQQGPFVMNTREELDQAFRDYMSQSNGFENARTWRKK